MGFRKQGYVTRRFFSLLSAKHVYFGFPIKRLGVSAPRRVQKLAENNVRN